jgi:hypothetical protein
VKLIYAYGEEDPEGDDPYYHGAYRGALSVYLLDPPIGIPYTLLIYLSF